MRRRSPYQIARTKLIKMFAGGRSGVYAITSLVNDRCYIGSSINPPMRFEVHLLDLRNKKHCNYRLQEDYDLHGESNFIFGVLWQCYNKCSRAELYRVEQSFIDRVKPQYNIQLKVKIKYVRKRKTKKTSRKIR